jgi:hypothetical protein
MEYRRALPLTWLNAASAAIIGIDDEAAYRLPSALFGAAAVPLLFLFGRRLVGTPGAALAAGLLALSEWHLVFSRQARMYAPFMLFFFIAVYGVWRWGVTGKIRDLALGLFGYTVAVALHMIGMLAAFVFLVPLALGVRSRRRTIALLALSPIAWFAGRLVSDWISEPFGRYPSPPRLETAAPPQVSAFLAGVPVGPALALLLALGVALGLWAAWRLPLVRLAGTPPARKLAGVSLAIAVGIFSSLGLAYAIGLCVVALFLMHPGARVPLIRRLWLPLLIIAALCLAAVTYSAVDRGLVEGLRQAVATPFPYPLYLARQSPGLIFLFLAAAVWLASRAPADEDSGARACVLAALLILAAFGAVSSWGPTRFLISAYPFVLLAAGFGLWRLAEATVRRLPIGRLTPRGAAAALTSAIVVSGVAGGHGIASTVRTVALDYGVPVNELVHTYPFRPDHKHPGEFVGREYRLGDIVVAEDPLQQEWYAGRADYWFRRYGDMRRYLGMREDGEVRDIYVESRPGHDVAMLDSLVEDTPGRVWLITSGETAPSLDHYLTSLQRAWLDSVGRARGPAFTGRDGVSKVYCLNCPDRRSP